MKRLKYLLLPLLCLSIAVDAQETFPENGAAHYDGGLYVLKGATIHVDAETRIDKGDLWIENGRIKAVHPSKSIPAYAVVKDCHGMHLYPSFIELYSDYGSSALKRRKSSGPQMNREDKGPLGWNQAIHPEGNTAQAFQEDPKEAEAWRKAGYGALLCHAHDGIIRAPAALIALSDKRSNESMIRSKAAQFMSFDKGSSSQDYPKSKMGAIALIRQSLYDSDWYAQTKGKAEELNLSLAALDENMGLPQFFVTEEKNDILRAQKIAEEFDFRFHYVASGQEYERALEMANTGSAMVLPLDFPKAYALEDPYRSKAISLSELRRWEQAPANAAYLAALGIPLAFTSKGLEKPGQIIERLRLCIAHGLSEKKALAGLTSQPAQWLGVEHELGALKKGYWANVLICDGPLFDQGTKHVENWIQGRVFPIEQNDDTHIDGRYDLNLDGNRYDLEVSGNHGKLVASRSRDTILVQIEEYDRQVQMHFQKEGSGVYRLHGTINRRMNLWSGRGISPSGKSIEWNCIRRKMDAPKKKDKVKFAEEELAKKSVLRFPNNAYGWKDRPEAEHLHIMNATVWTNGPQGVLKDADVLMSAGKIIAVGHNLNPDDYLPKSKEKPEIRSLDAYGKHVTCGIIDEHSHIAISRGVNEGTQASSAEVRIGDVLDPEDIDIYYQLAGGVTAAQILHGSANPIGGQSALIKLRWGLGAEALKIEGADGFIKFALGENVKQSNWGDKYKERFPQTRMGVEQVYYDYFHKALNYQREKEEWAKIMGARKRRDSMPSPLRTDLELEALSEILRQKRFITCHSYVQSEINMLMHVADSMGFRVNTFTHILEGYKVADKMKKHGVAASTFSDWWAYKYEVREATPYNASLLHEQGIKVAINSDDAEMGRRLNQEAAKCMKYGGMSEEEAWKTVTLYPAQILHLDQQMGSLEIGKDADVVIWDEHPLSIYAKVQMTFVDGIRYFDREEYGQRRQEAKAERALLEQKMLRKAGKKKSKAPIQQEKHRYHCDH